MARSVKRVVLVLLAAAVLAFAAWMLWPRSIGDAVDLEGEDFLRLFGHPRCARRAEPDRL